MQHLLTCSYCTFYEQIKWMDGWKTGSYRNRYRCRSFLRILYEQFSYPHGQHYFNAAATLIIPGTFLSDLCECCLQCHVQLLPERTKPSAGWQRFTDRWRDCISKWSEGRKFAVVFGRRRNESDNIWTTSTVAVPLSVESLWPVAAQSSPL